MAKKFLSYEGLKILRRELDKIYSTIDHNHDDTYLKSADLSDYAKTSALNDYVKTSTAESTYAKKSDITTVYKIKGSTSTIPTSFAVGDVYNISSEFTTTNKFVEGADKVYPAGTNIVAIAEGDANVCWDVLGSLYDLSELQVEIEEIPEEDIIALFVDEYTITYELSSYTYIAVGETTYTNESGTFTVPAGTVINLSAGTSAASPEGYTYIRVDGTTVASNPAASSGCEYNYTVNSNITVKGIDAGSTIISGEIDVTTQSSSSNGYTVKVTIDGMYGEYGYYSLDNGVTWKNFNDLSYDDTVGGKLITNVTQIKFKIDDYAYNNGISTSITCDEIGLSITQAGPRESENYILSSDIEVSYYDVD